MTKMDNATHFVSRRSLLKAGGALVVSIGTPVAFDTVLGIGAVSYTHLTLPTICSV